MMGKNEKTGRCLCGVISFTTESAANEIGACHCSMCRKWGGGPYMEIECGDDVVFEGSDKISIYKSSEWAERGFCKDCGTHLFYRLLATHVYSVPVGLFDDVCVSGDAAPRFSSQIFIDKKPGYYSFAEDTENMTEAEVFAKYAPQE